MAKFGLKLRFPDSKSSHWLLRRRAGVLASRAIARAQTLTHKLGQGEIKTYLSGKFWKTEALIWKGRVINQMPVEHVEFIVCHDIL